MHMYHVHVKHVIVHMYIQCPSVVHQSVLPSVCTVRVSHVQECHSVGGSMLDGLAVLPKCLIGPVQWISTSPLFM